MLVVSNTGENNPETCLVCGQTFHSYKSLLGHVRVHRLTSRQYREKFGLLRTCKKCGTPLSKNGGKTGHCNKCRDRTGENNPFFGKTHSASTVRAITANCRKASKTLWENATYRDKVISGVSKPRSDKGKENISQGVLASYRNIPGLRTSRQESMLRRISEGFDPTHGLFLCGEGWGESGTQFIH